MPATRLLTPVARGLLALQALLVLTGGAVRVTGSGLGCPTWPECTTDSYTPVAGQAEGTYHSWIEFGNRLLTFLLFFTAIAMVLLVIRSGRKDLRFLAFSQIAGIFGQAILGGITVLTHLNPFSVAAHFILSIILIAAAHTLLIRSEADRVTNPKRSLFISLHTALAFVVIAAGTLVTGAGPHAGDADAPRLKVAVATVATVHGFLVLALIAMTIAGIYKKFTHFASDTQQYLVVFLAVALTQGVVGYAQYLLGVPQLLVLIHLLGSSLLWIAAWRVRLTQYYSFTNQ